MTGEPVHTVIEDESHQAYSERAPQPLTTEPITQCYKQRTLQEGPLQLIHSQHKTQTISLI